MTVAADPDALDLLAAGSPGQAFALEVAAQRLATAGAWYRGHHAPTSLDTGPAVGCLRGLGDRVVRLDDWVRAVAAALRRADAEALDLRLLRLGPGHPVATAPSPTAAPVTCLTPAQLEALATVPHLPTAWRDRVHRERLRRWVDEVDARVAAVPDRLGTGPVDRFVRWFDRHVVDRVSLVWDLHVDADEVAARLRAEAAGATWLLDQPDLRLLSLEPPRRPSASPTVRVALGDPDTAARLAVLLPGTSTGLHAPRPSLADARRLHDAGDDLRPGDVATVLDLHAAPRDLGAAVDPAPASIAGAATAAFLTDLAAPGRTTLVGHSYGALTAATVTHDHPVDALVVLGAPGLGVVHRSQLTGAGEVWAARADADPIVAVADLDELVRGLPPQLRPSGGPLLDPLVAHGPDPTDPEFGAEVLPTGSGVDGLTANHGHVDYLAPGSVALAGAAAVVAGRRPGRRTTDGRTVRPARPPRRARPTSAGDA